MYFAKATNTLLYLNIPLTLQLQTIKPHKSRKMNNVFVKMMFLCAQHTGKENNQQINVSRKRRKNNAKSAYRE